MPPGAAGRPRDTRDEETPRLRVDLLGPVRASVDGRLIEVGPPRQQTLLAFLALRANRVVARDELVAALWGADPPASAANGVHGYVAALRRACEPGRSARAASRLLPGTAGGYLLRMLPGHRDVEHFDTLTTDAQRLAARDPAGAVGVFDSALRLWRGAALAGASGPIAEAERTRLSELRLVTLEQRAGTLLRLGDYDRVVADLAAIVVDHPLRERVRALLMTALLRSGRQAEALIVYAEARRVFAEELGVEPGPALRQLHQQVLTGAEPAAPARRERDAAPAAAPRQLPPALPYLAGRARELATLAGLAERAAAGQAMVTVLLHGPPGVGKTALALTLAHRVAGLFPDGQLYLNLRGFDPHGPATAPAEAVRDLLDGLGVGEGRLPARTERQVAAYRSRMAGTRTLVLLDNAADVTQVRPLLPGAPGCFVVITSRTRLTGLIAADGAYPVGLDVLTGDEARDLLRHRIGQRSVNGFPKEVDQIIARCGRLPLALSVVAARAAGPGTPTLADLAADLETVPDGVLDVLDGGDPAADVRTVFSWSYDRLSDGAAHLFRLLGQHPGPGATLTALASAAGRTVEATRRALAELVLANLAAEPSPGRYTCHDLLRAYAAERAATDPDEAARTANHYVRTAQLGARLLHDRDPFEVVPALTGVADGPVDDREHAMAWFRAEHAVLLAVLDQALATGADRTVVDLAGGLGTYLSVTAHWSDWQRVESAALVAAGRLGDRVAQARARHHLARAAVQLGRYAEAAQHIEAAVGWCTAAGDPVGAARAHVSWCMLLDRQGRFRPALHHAEAALTLLRSTDDRRSLAHALNATGWCHTRLGQYADALVYCDQARVLHEEVGDGYAAAETWDSVGYAHHHLGDHVQAIACYQRSLAGFRTAGDRYHEAEVLGHLGDSEAARADVHAARAAWLDATSILEDLDDPDADRFRARLAAGG